MEYKTAYDLPTPSYCINIDIFRRNCQKMISMAKQIGIRIRPHVKTHKTIEGANIQLEGIPDNEKAIVVSTLSELKYFADHGFNNILLGIPFAVHQLPQLEIYSQKINNLYLLIDDSYHIELLDTTLGHYNILIKIDTGYHRAGICSNDYDDIKVLIHKIQNSKTCSFKGIYSHAGHSYDQLSIQDIQNVADTEKSVMQELAKHLKEDSIICETVSCGSTPACSVYSDWSGITEIHPGNYCCYDRVQCHLGACKEADIAPFVVTTVLAHYPKRNTILCDCGGIPLSKDKGGLDLWASVIDHPELLLTKVSQEHGILTSNSSINYDKYPIGSKLLLHPNHSCMTAAAYPLYYIVDNNMNIVDKWIPSKYWN